MAVPSIDPRCAVTIASISAFAFSRISSNSSSASDKATTAPPAPIDNVLPAATMVRMAMLRSAVPWRLS